jgi:hypothetical protein
MLEKEDLSETAGGALTTLHTAAGRMPVKYLTRPPERRVFAKNL